MASEATRAAHRGLETLFGVGSSAGLTDGELLERFAGRRRPGDEAGQAAFEALVDRHGGMVLRACRRVLGDDHAAQDAAQATFLVLARRAGSVGRLESVGGWLHGVATRVATKARVASARRVAREQRGGAIAEGRRLDREASTTDPDRWADLHEELGLLPEKFRAPLVLCYLEGLTQEQAAEMLRCPLGTVQSRLARGRDRLKARLTSRGVAPSSTAGLLAVGRNLTPPPTGWAEAVARAAVRFTTPGSEALRAGAWPASAGLAMEALRAMMLTKSLKISALALLTASTLAVGAASLVGSKPDDPPVAAKVQVTPIPQPAVPEPPRNRTITGVVRDDRGQELAKVWVGSDPRPLMDTWDNPRRDDIRERPEPFRDAKGEILPPGKLGKYYEARDRLGVWRPVSPDDIQPFQPQVFNSNGAVPLDEVLKTYSLFNVRVEKGTWWMASLPGIQNPVRTDDRGRFSTPLTISGLGEARLHFASADWTLQAIRTIKLNDPDLPLAVTLRPTRLVRARVIEVPNDDPKAYLNWSIYAVDAGGKIGEEWQHWHLPNVNNHDPDHVKRRLEVRLPVGRWKAEFQSQTLRQLVDIEVPPGEGPLDLPDFRLASLATVRRIGQPAAEINATDLDGKLVRLADYRGQYVVLDFWATWCGPCIQAMPRLIQIQRRFAGKPLTILALHDASLAGPEEYQGKVERFQGPAWGGALPFRVLLDRPHVPPAMMTFNYGGFEIEQFALPPAQRVKAPSQAPGEPGSGRSAESYDVFSWPSTYLIDPDGKLVGRFELDALESELESRFATPRRNPPVAQAIARAVMPEPKRGVKVKGRVVGPDGRGVAGATLSPQLVVVREKGLKTDAEGGFAFEVEEIFIDHFFLRVEAPGLASKMFQIDDTGDVRDPLKLGSGVVVTGRVIRDGRPVPGASMGLAQIGQGRTMDRFLGDLSTKTGPDGRFRFEHAFAEQDLTAFAQTGGFLNHGAVSPRTLRTGGDGATVDLGDLEVKPGRKLAGRVVFSDGKAIPPGTLVLVSAGDSGGSLRAPVDPPTGRFEVLGLPEATVAVVVQFPDNPRSWLPPGYRISPTVQCLDPMNAYRVMGRLDRDVTDLTILFEPGPEPRMTLDPGRLADFEEAKARTITGAPPK